MKGIEHIVGERILFSPLNWGLGHVSRSIPLLRKLMKNGNEIHFACSFEQKLIFANYFSNVTFVEWDGYPFRFRGRGNFATDLLLSFPRLAKFASKEKKFVGEYAKKHSISMIISDQRYFFRSKQITSVFITHQFQLPLPFYLRCFQSIQEKWMKAFSEVWIADDVDLNLAGKLSQVPEKWKKPIRYLGLLSRFSEMEMPKTKEWTTVVVSGPEPYARQFYEEQKARNKNNPEFLCFLYNGCCETTDKKQQMTWLEMDERLLNSKKIISRNGYTTLMDLHFLQCEKELYPTKGQWEQVYLAAKK